mgnify:FL=1|jgi:hypothetical protein
MRNHKRDGKITFIELLLIAIIFVFGYFVIIAPMSKTNDMVKEDWVKNNLSTIFDAIQYLDDDQAFTYENMKINDVDILRAKWERAPLEWPQGVFFDSFKASSNELSLAVEFSTGVKEIVFNPPQIEE